MRAIMFNIDIRTVLINVCKKALLNAYFDPYCDISVYTYYLKGYISVQTMQWIITYVN